MPNLRPSSLFLRLENLLVLMLGASIFLSKPLIYASSGLLILYCLIRIIVDKPYGHRVLTSPLTWVSAAIYLLGVVATLIYPATLQDTAWIARKSLFLLSFVPLYFAFADQRNRNWGLLGLLGGFWIAGALTLLEANWRPEDLTRLDGATWLVDVWGVLCSLFAVFLVPRVYDQNTPISVRVLVALTVIASLYILFLSGARGPWLGAFIGIAAYLLLFQWKTLTLLVLIGAIGYFPARQVLPESFAKLEEKVASMVDTGGRDTATSESNWIRLQLWKLSIAQDKEKLKNEPLKLLFGSGPLNHLQEYKSFFNKTDVLPAQDKARLSRNNFPSNDVHSMYLDATAKMGLLWTVASVFWLILLAMIGLARRKSHGSSALGAPFCILTFLIIGTFYSLLPHFGTFFLFFFIALALQSNPRDGLARS
jgi:O-antigen ligase